MVPVGEGSGVTNGERSNLAGGRGLGGLITEEVAVMSSNKEVNESLICVEGNLIIHLKRDGKRLNTHQSHPVHVHAKWCQHRGTL